MTGTRPSQLFGWDDPNDWEDRITFDLYVMDVLLGGGK